jgi:ribA/ribD-fused uncharacterized protein
MIQWNADECITFWKSRDEFGGLSNMAGGYPIELGPHHIRTSEHLYQALRYPDHPDIQRAILAIPSPLIAKQTARESLALERPDWHEIKPDVMMWCLNLKLLHNRERFGRLLMDTNNRDIVEASPIDGYWGAKPKPHSSLLIGWNVLGRLLWMLRGRLEVNLPIDLRADVIDIPNFRLMGEDAIELATAKELA